MVGPFAAPFAMPLVEPFAAALLLATTSLVELVAAKGSGSPFVEPVELVLECVRERLCTTLDMAFLMDDMVERTLEGEEASMTRAKSMRYGGGVKDRGSAVPGGERLVRPGPRAFVFSHRENTHSYSM